MKVVSFEDIKNINEFVYDFLNKTDLVNLPEGRLTFNDGMYANVESYNSKPRHRFEAHKKYIDIQIVISGEEKIIVQDINDLQVLEEYNSDKDIVFYSDNNKGEEFILRQNNCLVLYPQDGHMPGVINDDVVKVKKMVFKLPIK